MSQLYLNIESVVSNVLDEHDGCALDDSTDRERVQKALAAELEEFFSNELEALETVISTAVARFKT
jgi:hypothetical protein